MTRINDRIEAQFEARSQWPSACDFHPITGPDGPPIGWTFATSRIRPHYAWILTDGRISPATEDYRSYAEQYALDTVKERRL